MHEQDASHAASQVRVFFSQVAALSPAQVRLLQRVPRWQITTPLGFAVHPDRLAGVSSGHWTQAHDALVAQAHRAARAHAARLVRLGRRRGLAMVLEGVALAVIVDDLPDPVLTTALRERLSSPWTTLIGPLPGHRAALPQAVAAQ